MLVLPYITAAATRVRVEMRNMKRRPISEQGCATGVWRMPLSSQEITQGRPQHCAFVPARTSTVHLFQRAAKRCRVAKRHLWDSNPRWETPSAQLDQIIRYIMRSMLQFCNAAQIAKPV